MKHLVCAALGFLLLTFGAREAQADLVLTLSDGTTSKTITDNGVGDNDPTVGAIAYASFINGPIGVFMVQITTGLSKPLIGNNADTARLKTSNTSVTSSTATGGTLFISLTDTDYNLNAPASGFKQMMSETGGVVGAGGVASMVSYFDPTNQEFGRTGPSISQGPFSGAFGDTATIGVAYAGGAFSLTQDITLTLDANSSASMDFDTTIPEPTGIALLAIGGLVVGFRRRRRA